METTDFRLLIDKYITGTLSDDEAAQFLSLMDRPQYRVVLEEVLRNAMVADEYTGLLDPAYTEGLIQQLQAKMKVEKQEAVVRRIPFLKAPWLRYAAVLLLIAGVAAYLYRINLSQKEIAHQASTEKPDILPGGNKALLTLSDGKTIVLDSAANGSLANQGNAQISKLSDGKIAYQSIDPSMETKVLYNTLSTPKGGQYQLTLQDGTKVWLNAASSISYPTVFNGNSRNVRITGEVYVEVAQNKQQPFFLVANGVEVQVLGTSFNVNAYANEQNMQTTLVEGSVLVRQNEHKVRLLPGQQAQVAITEGIRVAEHPDLEKVLAWKNGLFNFENADLPEVMRQLERWYDIEVVYEKGIPHKQFGGMMSKDIPLSGLLKVLKTTGVHFRIEGRKLIVLTVS
jgi:ferric-dicitrate binding protein FerR (iron transport regulator)